LNKLKVLNLSNSKDLTRLPDFSQVPQLEIIILEGCTGLVQVHKSIGCLKKLVLLNFKNCMNLKYIPRSIFNLESLETLDLSGCSALERLSRQMGNMMDLAKLHRVETVIYQQPSSFGGVLKNLKYLLLDGCSCLTELPNFLQVPHLIRLQLEGCTSLVEIHESIGYLRRLVLLNLRNCTNLKDLPRSIFNLESLETLDLSGCSALERLSRPMGNMMDLAKLRRVETIIYQQPSSFGSVLKNLSDLFLDGCSCLTELPNFLQVPHLRRLELEGCTSLVEIHESIGYLRRLVLLNLRNCTNLKDLPRSIFNLESLANFDLSGCSALEKLPKQLGNMMDLTKLHMDETTTYQQRPSFGVLKNLKYLWFTECSCLTELPNFLQAPNLVRLQLEGCTSLVEIHESIGFLKKLKSLALNKCKNLRNLPDSIVNLKSLEYLHLYCCSKLEKLPENLGNLTALVELSANRTAIKQVPISIGLLRNLGGINLSGCGGPSLSLISAKSSNRIGLLSLISGLCSLTTLDLSGRNLSEADIPFEFGCLSSLRKLELSRNNFRNLPSCMSFPPNLTNLCLNECIALQSISLPRSIASLQANDCTSLERVVVLNNDIFTYFSLNNCHKLIEIQNMMSCGYYVMGRCNNLAYDFRKSVFQVLSFLFSHLFFSSLLSLVL
jgi:Leucine-rich repeat (LRR) protein